MSHSCSCVRHKHKRVSEGIDPHILNVDCSWRWVVCFTPRPLYLGRSPQYPLKKRLGGVQNRSRRFGVDKKNSIKMLSFYDGEDLYCGILCYDSMGPGRWSKKFRRNTLTLFSVQVGSMLKTEAVFSSGTLVRTYQITRRHIDIYQTEVKRLQCEVNHLPVSSADVINFSIFISTPQICLHNTVHRHTLLLFPDEKSSSIRGINYCKSEFEASLRTLNGSEMRQECDVAPRFTHSYSIKLIRRLPADVDLRVAYTQQSSFPTQ
jgi:hypothetical protein